MITVNAEEPEFPDGSGTVIEVSDADTFKTKFADTSVTGIKLTGDVTVDAGLSLYHALYIDLNGHTLTSSAGTAIETKARVI